MTFVIEQPAEQATPAPPARFAIEEPDDVRGEPSVTEVVGDATRRAISSAVRGAGFGITPEQYVEGGKAAGRFVIETAAVPSAGVGGVVDLLAGKGLQEAAKNVEARKGVGERITELMPDAETTSLPVNVVLNIMRALPGEVAEFAILEGVVRGAISGAKAIGQLKMLRTPRGTAIADTLEKSAQSTESTGLPTRGVPEAPPPSGKFRVEPPETPLPPAEGSIPTTPGGIPPENPLSVPGVRPSEPSAPQYKPEVTALEDQMAAEELGPLGATAPGKEVRVGEQEINNLTESMKVLATNPTATDRSRRVFQRLVELVERGEISDVRLAEVAKKEGLDPIQLAQMVGEEFSRSGRVLNRASQIVKALDASFAGNAEAQQILRNLKPAENTLWSWLKPKIEAVEGIRRRSLVTQLATAVRNAGSQGVRYLTEIADDALGGVVKAMTGRVPIKESFSKAIEDTFAITRALVNPKSRNSLKILEQFPTEAERLLGSPVGDVLLSKGGAYGKALDVLNTANIAQESFFRKLVFDAKSNAYLRSKGIQITAENAAEVAKQIPETKIAEFVDDALKATFAKSPEKGTLTSALLRTYRELPFLTALGNPFPRFWVNSLSFLYEHSPLGVTQLFTPAIRTQLLAGNPRLAAEAMGKVMTGSAFMTAAYALRESDKAGPKWYQIKLGDGRMLDARPFAPFSTYLYLADVIRKKQGKPTQIDGQDMLQAMVSINRIAGTGLAVVDMVRANPQQAENILQRWAGEWAGSFSVPARTAHDLMSAVSDDERTLRTTRESPMTGPFRANIPGASQALPPFASGLRKSPIIPSADLPLRRQFMGQTIQEQLPLEAEVKRLGITSQELSPKTGDAEVDRLILTKMGEIVDENSEAILESLKDQESDDVKKVLLADILADIKGAAAEAVKGELEPDQRGQLLLRKARGMNRLVMEKALREEK